MKNLFNETVAVLRTTGDVLGDTVKLGLRAVFSDSSRAMPMPEPHAGVGAAAESDADLAMNFIFTPAATRALKLADKVIKGAAVELAIDCKELGKIPVGVLTLAQFDKARQLRTTGRADLLPPSPQDGFRIQAHCAPGTGPR